MKNNQKNGVQRISLERHRQINHLHLTSKHDDEHISGELAILAACYAANAACINIFTLKHLERGINLIDPHPWPEHDARLHNGHGYPRSVDAKIELLEKAGALIAAEIDRLLRLERS